MAAAMVAAGTGRARAAPYGSASPVGPMLRHLTVLAAALLLLPGVQAAEIVVKEGDTLSELAERHGVSTETLMRLNDLEDPSRIEVGQTLRLGPGGGDGSGGSSSGAAEHVVQEGDTLSAIAARYDTTTSALASLNDIDDDDLLQVGDRLRLPGGPRSEPAAAAAPIKADPSAEEHVVERGQTLSRIAEAYDIPMARLVALNDLSDPDQLKVGTRLVLRGTPETAPTPEPEQAEEKKQTQEQTQEQARVPRREPAGPAPEESALPNDPDWRPYGPLRVDWANWQPMGGSHVAPTLNREGQPLYLAVNCQARRINATGASGAWKTWDPPRTDFEKKLVDDICREKGS
jgi:LysM repeat protein